MVHFYTTLHILLMGQNIHVTCPPSCYCTFPVHMYFSSHGLSYKTVRISESIGSVKLCNWNDWKQANHQNLQSYLLPNQQRFARPSPHHQTRKCRLRVLAYAMQQEQITVPPVARNALIYIACRQTHTCARAPALTHAHTCTRARAHTHTHTHTHTGGKFFQLLQIFPQLCLMLTLKVPTLMPSQCMFQNVN